MSELTKKELRSWVEEAVQATSIFKCPEQGCGATFTEPAQYMDHRIGESFAKMVAEVKAPEPEKFLTDCKDGICKIVDDHIKEKYDVAGKEEEEEPGLFSLKDDEE